MNIMGESMLQNTKIRLYLSTLFLGFTAILCLTITSTQNAKAAQTWNSTCVPAGVAVYTTRIHIKCTAAVGGISYFAVSTADKDHAARVLNTISTAQALGRTVSILYDPAVISNLPTGCQSSDCRTLLAVGFGQ